MTKLSFSGHESFICRQFWLKKGYDFVKNGGGFKEEKAVIDLGVGKNMVASVRFWLKAFGLTDENDNLTKLGEYLFGNKGKDPYLEDFGTLWLLHYHLLKTGRASIYSLVFNEFRKERIDFTKEQLYSFLKRKTVEMDSLSYNENTINSDIRVLVRTYTKPQKDEKVEIEDDFTGVLMDLDLLKHYKLRNSEGQGNDWYKLESEERIDLPYHVVLFSILDNYTESKTIAFKELLTGENSPGLIFALTSDGLYNKIKQIEDDYSGIIFTETAGNQVLQFKSKPDKYHVLNDYYAG